MIVLLICSLFSYSWGREFVLCMDGLINWLIVDWLIDWFWLGYRDAFIKHDGLVSMLLFKLKFFFKKIKPFFNKIRLQILGILHFLCHINVDVRPWVSKSLSFIKDRKWVCLEATTATEKKVCLEVSKQQVIVPLILFCLLFLESFQVANLKAELAKAGTPSGFAMLDSNGRLPHNLLEAGLW